MTTAMEHDRTLGPDGSPRQGDQLQAAASGLIDQATRTAEAQASTTMTKVGETLETVAKAIRDAGSELREQQPQISGVVDTAAERVESAATYLREHSAGEALDNVQRIARSNPALVIGGGLALGLVLGRVLRGGASAVQEGQGGSGTSLRGGYGDGYRDTYGYGDASASGGYASAGASRGGARLSAMGATGATGAASYEAGAGSYGVAAGTPATSDVGADTDIGSELQATDLAGGRTGDADLMDDSATGDGVRDEAPTAESR